MSDAAWRSYLDTWLAARPARRLALPFMQGPRRDVRLALAALEQQWLDAAHGIGEPQVAAAKLQWWAEELAGAPASGGRHPLIQVLFADELARAVAGERWLAPVLAALAQLEDGTPGDFAGQRQAAQPFHGALAALETAVWFGPGVDVARAAHVACLDHLLWSLARLQETAASGRLPLPMSRLAQHHLDRDALASDTPARRAALHAQLADIRQAWEQTWHLPGPLTTLRGLDARLGQHGARRAARAAEPLAALHAVQARQTGPTTLWRAWSAARACQRAEVMLPDAGAPASAPAAANDHRSH